jgi:hypothetical protein
VRDWRETRDAKLVYLICLVDRRNLVEWRG